MVNYYNLTTTCDSGLPMMKPTKHTNRCEFLHFTRYPESFEAPIQRSSLITFNRDVNPRGCVLLSSQGCPASIRLNGLHLAQSSSVDVNDCVSIALCFTSSASVYLGSLRVDIFSTNRLTPIQISNLSRYI